VIREIETAIKDGIIREIDPDLAAYGLTGLIEIMSLRLSLDKKCNLENKTALLTLSGESLLFVFSVISNVPKVYTDFSTYPENVLLLTPGLEVQYSRLLHH
jgi:hypothetical protein